MKIYCIDCVYHCTNDTCDHPDVLTKHNTPIKIKKENGDCYSLNKNNDCKLFLSPSDFYKDIQTTEYNPELDLWDYAEPFFYLTAGLIIAFITWWILK